MIEIPVEDLNHQVKLISVCGDTIGLQNDPIHPIPLPQPSDGGAIVLQPAAYALPSAPAFAFGGSHEASEADLILRYNGGHRHHRHHPIPGFNCGKGDGM